MPWMLRVTPAAAGEWAVYDVPVTFAAGWIDGPGADPATFFNDMRAVDWVGVSIVRGGGRGAQEFGMDDFLLQGETMDGFVDPLDDRDGDGLPDTWEDRYGFDVDRPGDEVLDADGDGMSNLREYLAGTNPLDPDSLLAITDLALVESELRIERVGAAGRTQVLEWTEALDLPWTPVYTDTPPHAVSDVLLDWPATRGYFRLRVGGRSATR